MVELKTLKDYLDICEEGAEVTVWDTVYDTEFYFYAQNEGKWDEISNEIAGLVELVKIRQHGVVVDMWNLVDKHIDKINEADLFNDNVDTEAVMEMINQILSGYVSESWLERFVEALKD